MKTVRRGLLGACFGVLVAAGAASGAAPGPIDGASIPSDFGGANELVAQTNQTSFGDQSLGTGDFAPGSEMDGLYLAKDADFLYIGVTGNLERNGHAYVIFIDVDNPFFDGQMELRSEGVGGPPFAVQTASREIVINTNGPGDSSDDTWEYGTNGTTLPCAPDFAIAIDVFGGTMSISEYALFNPTGGSVGTFDPTPDNLGDGDLSLYASRTFIGQTAINDGNDVLENLQLGNDYGPGGFDNTNTSGVTSVDAVDANAATTGMELAIPLSNFQGVDNLNILVSLVDGGGSTGLFVPQQLPSITDQDVCTSSFVMRQDLSTTLACLPVTVSTLPDFTGSADGSIDAAEYGAAVTAVQECPTTYGDQFFDPDATTVSGGSELDVLYATNDDKNLYLGITGNLEANNNQLVIYIDTDTFGADLGTNGRELDALGNFVGINTPGAGGAIAGMNGDALPEVEFSTNGDISTNAVNFNFAFAINGSGSNVWMDGYDFETKSFSFIGQTSPNANNGGVLTGGANPESILMAYNNTNEAGVLGNCFDAGSCLFMTTNGTGSPAQVATLAHSATVGHELCIPWAAINVDSNNLPTRMHLWAIVTGSGDFASNQSLPPMRPRTNNTTDSQGNPISLMTDHAGNGPNDYSDGKTSAGNNMQMDSYAAQYTVKAGVLCAAQDVNCDGAVNAGDIGAIANPLNFQQNPPACDRTDTNGDGSTNAGDIGDVANPLNFQQSPPGTGLPCTCVTNTPGAC